LRGDVGSFFLARTWFRFVGPLFSCRTLAQGPIGRIHFLPWISLT
jgi:hypothetical protein